MIGDVISAVGSLVGGYFDRQNNRQIADQNIALQREFAQSGIQWKVNDAKAAGIHPLAALGAQTSSFSPVSVGDSGSFADMGQNLGRAIKAASAKEDRDAQELTQLGLTRARLENDLIRSQITASQAATQSRRAGAVGPPMPTPPVTRTSVMDAPVTADKIETKQDTYPAVLNYRFAGIPLETNPWFSDAQDIENRLGEGMSDYVGGPINGVGDVAYTLWRQYQKRFNPGAYGRESLRRGYGKPMTSGTYFGRR